MRKTPPLREVRVFLASPGDVPLERAAVREAVARVNRLVAKPHGVLFDVTGWETVPPGRARRAQQRINPYVETAEVFIGIFNCRFGTPTGVAESGTKEEYDIVTRRSNDEAPGPDIKIYFKRLAPDLLAAPGKQLRQVLRFRKAIAKTDFFQEFHDAAELQSMVELALSDWVYESTNLSPKASAGAEVVEPRFGDVLAVLAACNAPELSSAMLATELGVSADAAAAVVARMAERGVVDLEADRASLPDSTAGFLAAVQHAFDGSRFRQFASSKYFTDSMRRFLPAVVLARFHLRVPESESAGLWRMAIASPSVARYLLLGDTEPYDRAAEHGHAIGKSALAHELMFQSLLRAICLRFITDSVGNATIDDNGPNPIEGQVLHLSARAANVAGPIVSVSVVTPTVRFRAKGAIKAGQIVSGEPGHQYRSGLLLMHMGELGLAIHDFNELFSQDLPVELKAEAWNNVGICHLRLGNVQGAVGAFREALALVPNHERSMSNLKTVSNLDPPEGVNKSSPSDPEG